MGKWIMRAQIAAVSFPMYYIMTGEDMMLAGAMTVLYFAICGVTDNAGKIYDQIMQGK